MGRMQRRFLAQHSIAMLGKCCSYLKQCRNNVAMLCCAKNRRCESFPVTSPLTSLQALVYHLVNSFGLPFWVTMTVFLS